MTNICEPGFIKQDFLDNKDSNSLGQLGASLHDSETERNDLRGEQEMDDSVVVILLAKTQKVIRVFGNRNKQG